MPAGVRFFRATCDRIARKGVVHPEQAGGADGVLAGDAVGSRPPPPPNRSLELPRTMSAMTRTTSAGERGGDRQMPKKWPRGMRG